MRPCHFSPRRGGVLGIGQLVVLKESEENNEENSIRELHVDPISNSSNLHRRNCVADGNENY